MRCLIKEMCQQAWGRRSSSGVGMSAVTHLQQIAARLSRTATIRVANRPGLPAEGEGQRAPAGRGEGRSRIKPPLTYTSHPFSSSESRLEIVTGKIARAHTCMKFMTVPEKFLFRKTGGRNTTPCHITPHYNRHRTRYSRHSIDTRVKYHYLKK